VDNNDVMERLAFIRYLHFLGVEQSRKTEPFSRASVLMFHDVIELYLELRARSRANYTVTSAKLRLKNLSYAMQLSYHQSLIHHSEFVHTQT
jgi:hypothetical protein